ncbi:hypothetical protein WK78_22030 [Burkholderia cepacia]|nr:hypothetical protein WK78_22030 [Burkholderia cepacia]OQD21307.1 hypothetical protein UE98_20620 [Burkholderia cenocepacia]
MFEFESNASNLPGGGEMSKGGARTRCVPFKPVQMSRLTRQVQDLQEGVERGRSHMAVPSALSVHFSNVLDYDDGLNHRIGACVGFDRIE